MKVSLLNVRITVQENSVETDDIGNHMNSWKDFYYCYATVSGETGNESDEAGLTVDDSKMDFTIRWCKTASLITADKHRVIFNDGIYDITGIDHMNFKKKSLKLKCRKVMR